MIRTTMRKIEGISEEINYINLNHREVCQVLKDYIDKHKIIYLTLIGDDEEVKMNGAMQVGVEMNTPVCHDKVNIHIEVWKPEKQPSTIIHKELRFGSQRSVTGMTACDWNWKERKMKVTDNWDNVTCEECLKWLERNGEGKNKK